MEEDLNSCRHVYFCYLRVRRLLIVVSTEKNTGGFCCQSVVRVRENDTYVMKFCNCSLIAVYIVAERIIILI